MIKWLVLAGWHSLSDYEVEPLATDRLSVRHFPGYPEKIPDRSTMWLFRENLTNNGKLHLILDEIRRKLDEHGHSIKRVTPPFASIDKLLRRSVRGKSVSTKDKRRNRAISRTQSLVERPFAVIKRVSHAGHVMVTPHFRIHVKISSPVSHTISLTL
jgi:IS5 family transposase